MWLKKKLENKKLYDKLLEYKKIRNQKDMDVKAYILNGLQLIKNELSKCSPVKNNKYILGARQQFVLEEFEKYVQEQNYEGAYYDIEDFIGFQRIPIDFMNGLKETKYISNIEVDKIQYMISVLKSKLN